MSKQGPISKVSYAEAERALQASLDLLDPNTQSNIRNLAVGLLGVCQNLEKLQYDVGLLHRKLQPILKHLEEENADWRSRYPNYEE